MEKKYIVTVNSPEEEKFEIGVSHVSDEINIAIKLNQSVPGKKTDMKVSITPCDAKVVNLPEKVISGTASAAFGYYMGCNCTSYTVTPDASGNWSIPVAKFDGVTDMSNMFDRCTSLKTIRMAGCSEATINRIKDQLRNDRIMDVTIVTE